MKDTFAILHELPETQFLITSKWNPDTEDFGIDIKFWCVPINGFITLTLGYGSEQEESYQKAFDEFKSIENAAEWIVKFEKQYLTEKKI